MNISSTASTFNMDIPSNLTHDGQSGTCVNEDRVFLIFTLWDILDKLVVMATNGGTLIIIYLHRYAMLDIPSNIFIACLTMADLLSVVALPFRIASTYLSHTWVWTVNCFLSMYMAYTVSMVNTVILCVIAIDRMIYVVYPLEYHTIITVNRAFLISTRVWVFCALYSLLAMCLGYRDAYDFGMIARPCRWTISISGGLGRTLLQIPFTISVPVIIGSYIKVGMVALKQRNMITAAAAPQAPSAGINFKVIKVMLNVLSVYILCTLVVIVTPRIRLFIYLQEDTCGVVFRVTVFIWRINTWLNPVIYAWKSQKFRRYMWGVFNRNQVDSSDFNLI